MQKNTGCKICNSTRLRLIKRYTVSRQLGGEWSQVFERIKGLPHPLSIRLVLCLNCSFLFYMDTFSYKEMKQFYEEEARYTKPKEHKLKSGRRWEIGQLLNFLKRNLPLSEIKTALDLGAGDFVALEKISKLNPKIDFEAVDPSYPEASHKGIKIYQTMIEDLKPIKKYDFVTAIHILEHVGDLNAFLKKTERLVNDHGYFYVEVPFQVGPGLLLNRSASVQHVNFYTPATISYLLNVHGFRVKKIEFDTSAYSHNGMPGMIRVLTQKRKTKAVKPQAAETVRYLLNPFLILKSKFQTKVTND